LSDICPRPPKKFGPGRITPLQGPTHFKSQRNRALVIAILCLVLPILSVAQSVDRTLVPAT
jgi:hypothetical protein